MPEQTNDAPAAKPRSRRRAVAGVLVPLAAAALGVFYLFDPAQSRFFLPCVFRWATGLYCPGCGAQRAIHHLVHADLAGAMRSNPLLVLALPLAGYEMIRRALNRMAGKRLRSVMARPIAIATLMMIVIAFWIGRNIPYRPYNLLAPHP